MTLLLDEMYPAALADALRAAAIDATTVAEQQLAGADDAEAFAQAVAAGYVVLTENVGDFTRIAVAHGTAGGRHPRRPHRPSFRFSRRRPGIPALVASIRSLGDQALDDRIVYLEQRTDR